MEYYTPALSIVLGALIISIVLYIRNFLKFKNYWKDRGVPHTPSLNLFSALKFIYSKPFHELFLDSYKKFGRIYGTYEFRNPILIVNEPELLRDILVKDFNAFNCRRDLDFGERIPNKMITVLKGEDWKRVRTVITPAFTSRKMRQMSHLINECSKTVVKTLKKHAEEKEPADIKGIFGAFTLDVIASAAFATKIDSHNDPDNEFVTHAKKGFEEPPVIRLLSIFVLPGWFKRLFGIKSLIVGDFFFNVILQVIKERRETGKRYDDLLQLLMDAQDETENETMTETESSKDGIMLKDDVIGDENDQFGSVTNNEVLTRFKYKKLSQDELMAQCVLFFLVGYETTASTLTFMAYALALNQECQDKLIEEVDEVFKKHENLDYDVIRDMKYLDCVVSETLRMYPILVRSERTACEDYKLRDTGITIEKGIMVGFDIYAMHRDPEFFSNPEKFEPERFMSENISHPPYAYLPFGAGPRNCLGMRFALMEIKLCMTNILRYYKLKPAKTTQIPPVYKKAGALLGVNSLILDIERRNKE